jgi:hypothetical protein
VSREESRGRLFVIDDAVRYARKKPYRVAESRSHPAQAELYQAVEDSKATSLGRMMH